MSYIGQINIAPNSYVANKKALLFCNDEKHFAFIPSLLDYPAESIKIKSLITNLIFDCIPYITIEELSICIMELQLPPKQKGDKNMEKIFMNINTFIENVPESAPLNLKDRMIVSHLFPKIPTHKIKNNNFVQYDESGNIQYIKSDRKDVYFYAPFILSIINAMIKYDKKHLKQINIKTDHLIMDSGDEDVGEVRLLEITRDSQSYPNGKSKLIFREGYIIQGIDKKIIPENFKFECPTELNISSTLKLNVLIYLVIKSTFNTYINIMLSKPRPLPGLDQNEDKVEDEYITKNFKVSGLHYSQIYSTYISCKKDEIMYNGVIFQELSEDLLHYIAQCGCKPTRNLMEMVRTYYKGKRHIVMTKPEIEINEKTFSLNFVSSINDFKVGSIADMRKKLNDHENKFVLFIDGKKDTSHRMVL